MSTLSSIYHNCIIQVLVCLDLDYSDFQQKNHLFTLKMNKLII